MARASTQKFVEDLDELLGKFAGKISNAEAIGVLVIKAVHLAQAAGEDDDADK